MNHTSSDGSIRLIGPTVIESNILGSRGLDLGWLMRDVVASFRDGALSKHRLTPRVVFAACAGKPCIHLGYQTIPSIRYEVALASECVDRNELTGEQAKSACGRALTQLAANLDDPPLNNDYYVRFDTMTHSSEVLISEILDGPTLGQFANAETTSGRPVNPSDWATPGMTYRVDVGATKMPRAVAIPFSAPILRCGDGVVYDTEQNVLHRHHSASRSGNESSGPTPDAHSAPAFGFEVFRVVGTATVLNGDLPDGPSITTTNRGAVVQDGGNLYILERRGAADTHR